jgi:Domain of unknown function (DUF4395)
MSTVTTTPGTVPGIDPRGPRVAATLTSAVLALVLLTPTRVAVVLLAAQAAVFAVGAVRGVQHTPYAVAFRRVVRPVLGPPDELEDPDPPRFAQTVGLVFAVAGLAGFLAGSSVVGLVATGLALVAALLNATVGLCLGCEMYLILQRATAPDRPTLRTHAVTRRTER